MRTVKFKSSEVGPIPMDWECDKIGNLASVCTGNRNTQDKSATGRYPFYVRSPIVERIDDFGFDTEGVITVGDGVGTGKVFHYVNGKFALHQRCYLIDGFKENVSAKYFYKIFATRFYDRVMQMTAKSSVDSVRREMITEMNIPVPPRVEQERIAEALSDVDALLSAMTTLIEKKRAIKQGAMQQLLTGKKRLAGFTGPWVEKRFDDCFEHIPSKAYQIQSTDYLNGGRYEVIDQGQNDVVGYTNDKTRLFKVPNGGVIIFGDHTRIVKYRQMDFVVGADGTQLLVGKGVDTRFLSMVLQNQDIPNLGYARHFKFVKEGRYHLPLAFAEQQAIAAVLSDMDAEIAALEVKRAKYESVKQGMMQELLTGSVRLVG